MINLTYSKVCTEYKNEKDVNIKKMDDNHIRFFLRNLLFTFSVTDFF